LRERLDNLPEDKKEKIIAASLQEFAAKGYEQASTNTITHDAGISKGLLFHYFGSKKKLFLWLVDHCLELGQQWFRQKKLTLSSDIVERALEIGVLKLEYFHQHQRVSLFLATAFMDPPKELQDEMAARIKIRTTEALKLLYGDVDMSLFREGIDKNKAMEMLMMTMEGLRQKYSKLYKGQWDANTAEKSLTDFRAYMEIFKYGAYKNE
jgi:TetR/AcrR family transcriptional regulator